MDQVWLSILAAVVYAISGYFKSKPESFDRQKFLSTVILGFIIGVIQVALKLDYEAAYSFGLSLGLVPIVENAVKAIWRRVKK